MGVLEDALRNGFSVRLMACITLTLELTLKLFIEISEKYKRLTLHNFLYIIYVTYIYYETDLKDYLLYYTDS
jgi:hypothetical protein